MAIIPLKELIPALPEDATQESINRLVFATDELGDVAYRIKLRSAIEAYAKTITPNKIILNDASSIADYLVNDYFGAGQHAYIFPCGTELLLGTSSVVQIQYPIADPTSQGSSLGQNLLLITAPSRWLLEYTGDGAMIRNSNPVSIYITQLALKAKVQAYHITAGSFYIFNTARIENTPFTGLIEGNVVLWHAVSYISNNGRGCRFINVPYIQIENMWHDGYDNKGDVAYTSKTGTFQQGETVTSSSGGSATVLNDWTTEDTMTLAGISGVFQNGDTLTTASGSATMNGDIIKINKWYISNPTTPLSYLLLSDVSTTPTEHIYGIMITPDTKFASGVTALFRNLRTYYTGFPQNIINPASLSSLDANIEANDCDKRFIKNSINALFVNIPINATETSVANADTYVPITALFETKRNARFRKLDTCSFDNTNNTFSSTGTLITGDGASGLQIGSIVQFKETTGAILPVGLEFNTNYFITANIGNDYTHTFSNTLGGTDITFSDNGSGNHYYRHTDGKGEGNFEYIGIAIIDSDITINVTLFGTAGGGGDIIRLGVAKLNTNLDAPAQNEILDGRAASVSNSSPSSVSITQFIENIQQYETIRFYGKNQNIARNFLAEDGSGNIKE